MSRTIPPHQFAVPPLRHAIRLALASAMLAAPLAHAQSAAAPIADMPGSGPGAAEATLATVTVQGARDTATEDTGSYTTGEMRTATRLGLSARETPQSTTVITHQRIEDQAMTSVADVVKHTPGLHLSSADGPGRPSFSARGFDIDKVMYDGLPAHYQGWGIGTLANLAMFDRVEIVRGATGLVTGSGNPSAAINMVRKRPTRDTRVALAASAASWDDYRGEIDASGQLGDGVRGRVVGSYQNGGTFRTAEKFYHGLLYGVVEADLGPRTTLFAGMSYQDDYTNSFWGGLPLAADGQHMNLPRSTNPSNEWERKDQELATVFADLEHRLGNGWSVRLAATRAEQKATFYGTYLQAGDVPNRFAHSFYRADYDEDRSAFDAFASGPVALFGRRHEVSLGVSGRETKTARQNYENLGLVSGDIDIRNWHPSSTAAPRPSRTGIATDVVRERGVNAMTRLNPADSVKVILGGRLDWYEYDDRSGDGSYKVPRNVTRYAGVLYDVDARHTLYASFTDVFQPQTAQDNSGRMLEPVTGKNYEAGVKGEYFGGALNAGVALFQVDQANRAKLLTDQSGCVTFPAISCSEASGLVRSKGIDLELQGSITPGWQVGAGFTYTSTRYVRDSDASKAGTQFDTDTPRQLFKLSTQYQLPGADGWRIGGSLYRQGSIWNDVPVGGGFVKVEQEAYALLDLMASWRVNSRLDVQLNVANVFDKRYYRGIGYDTFWGSVDTYGDPRKVQLTGRYRF
ncbi:TonB-dependent siderophore receptor [Pseudoduganella albidiflava]|uniref:TonB-dependent receptor n=2 Tax=Pseudoduganella albidiflava TaxID=321983 RepID=A0AA87XW78_9BURK|nr:TonB-dependent siderophore receptor [Pseudoduganella albidiflava]GGY49787.1 TonB-dependent receptor [Pseudoduganella albidiflava]